MKLTPVLLALLLVGAAAAHESIGLSVGEPAVDLGGGVAPAPVDAVEVAEVGADQGPALRRGSGDYEARDLGVPASSP
jgi:hypothetical protein